MTAMPPRPKPQSKKPLRIGFDLDGVVLYNPARIIRRPVTMIKHIFVPKKEKRFYIPRTKPEKALWHLLHWSSFMVSPGFHNIHAMARKGLIEPYIVTARYSFLKKDFEYWAKKLNFPVHFKGHFMNEKNEQPHEFKERMVRELKLDMFVEDNLNIVEHLNKTTDCEVLWIYNIFDTFVPYKHKYPTLKKALVYISAYVKKPAKKRA